MCIKRLSLLLLLLWGLLPISTFSQNYAKVTGLDDDWLVYDESYQTFVPYVSGTYETLHLWMDINKYKGYYLTFNAHSNTSVFINSRLVKVIESPGTVYIPVSSIQSLASENKALISFYNQNENLPYNNISITSEGDPASIRGAGLNFIYRNQGKDYTFSFTLFIAFIATIAILKNAFPRKFREMTSVRRLFQGYVTEEQSSPFSLFSSTGFLSLLFCSGAIALVYVSMNMSRGEDEYGQLYIFLTSAILVLLFFFGKYLFIRIIANVFNISSLRTIHFQETLRASFLFMMLAFPLFAIIKFSNLLDVQFSYIDFFYMLLALFSVMLLRLMFLIFTLSNFRNIYLFSYLCVSEILPLLIILKIILVVQ